MGERERGLEEEGAEREGGRERGGLGGTGRVERAGSHQTCIVLSVLHRRVSMRGEWWEGEEGSGRKTGKLQFSFVITGKPDNDYSQRLPREGMQHLVPALQKKGSPTTD